jgi:GNAT superfamily N-acetyltransferase
MFKIVTASTTDIPVIQLLVEQIWLPTYQPILTPEQIEYMVELMYSTKTLSSQFTELGHHFLLLYDDVKPIGYASYSSSDTPGIYKLQKIYVHPGYQGQGVGKLFINHVIDAVKAAGGMILELNVNKYNKARFFYEKQGFTIHEEKDIDIGNGYWMNDYIMRRVL